MEHIQPENSRAVKEGDSKKAGKTEPTGLFGRLLAGLLRKNQNVQAQNPQPREAENSALSGELRGLGENKKSAAKKPVLAGVPAHGTVEKRGAEELIDPKKQGKAEKPEKKTAHEELSQIRTLAGNAAEPDTPEPSVAAGPRPEDAAGIRDFAHEEKAAGVGADKKPGKGAVDISVSLEKPVFSPVFPEKKQEKPAEIRSPETKTRDKRKDRFAAAVEVTGLRQVSPEAETVEALRAGGREFTVELRASGGRAFAGESFGSQQAEAGEAGGFEKLLAEQLTGDLSPNIVKQAAIVLRDGGEGTIRLSLKPETLGKVKIHLEMAENKVTGHIFVENEEALRAFEKEIHTLEQAFRDSGFADASLDTALGSGNGGNRREEQAVPFFSERFAASNYDSVSGSQIAISGLGGGFSTVNLLV
jgi:hypothetical protein